MNPKATDTHTYMDKQADDVLVVVNGCASIGYRRTTTAKWQNMTPHSDDNNDSFGLLVALIRSPYQHYNTTHASSSTKRCTKHSILPRYILTEAKELAWAFLINAVLLNVGQEQGLLVIVNEVRYCNICMEQNTFNEVLTKIKMVTGK